MGTRRVLKLMGIQHNESHPAVRPQWLATIVTESQRIAGQSHVMDRDDARPILTAFVRALPAPESQVERLVLRAILLDVAWRSGRAIHSRACPERRRGALRGDQKECSFVPGVILDSFWKVPTQHPEAAFLCWLDAFFEALGRTHPPSVVTRVSQLIRQDYRRTYHHTDLARRFHVSSAQLRHDFQGRFGMSIREYQQEVRLIVALEQMRTGKIDAIALQVGYRSKKNFYHALKQVTGLTPTEFRGLSDERAQRLIHTVGVTSSRRATAADRRRH